MRSPCGLLANGHLKLQVAPKVYGPPRPSNQDPLTHLSASSLTKPPPGPVVALLAPARTAVSGVTTHLNQLLGCSLAEQFALLHFQVGSEGRDEATWHRLWRLVASPIAFIGFMLRHRVAIVHLNTSLEHKSYWRDIAYLLGAKLLRRQVVYQVHGGALPADFFAGQRLLTSLLKWVLTLPDVVVVLAEVERAAYRAFVGNQRIELVANAIAPGGLLQRPLTSPAVGPLHLVYLGRLAREKGVFEILEALKMASDQGHDLRLTVAGSGPQEDELRARCEALLLTGRVRFAGALHGEQKTQLWQNGQVFVFPTYHREGLPYALLEALAGGAVPITTTVGAMPDVVQHGVHALLVKAHAPEQLACAIAQLDDDRALLLRLAQAGRARLLQHYTVERLAGDFQRIYATLAPSSAPCVA